MPVELPEQLDAGPIVLQRRRLSDVIEIQAAIEGSLTELSAFIRWAAAGVPTLRAIEAWIEKRDAEFEAGTGFEYVMREAATGELVGEAGGGLREGAVVEIGYWVRTDRTGCGYATAAAKALTSAAFQTFPDLAFVEIRMDKGNVRSRQIPSRLGFELVGEETFEDEPLSGQTGEGYIWSTARARWGKSGIAKE